MKYSTLIFSLMLSSTVYSQENKAHLNQTYLCIAEKMSFVEKSKTEGINAKSELFEHKYIITPNGGLKHFGHEQTHLDNCHYMNDGRPNFCEASGEGWRGEFIMDSDKIFVLSEMHSFEKGAIIRYSWQIGKCSIL